MKRPALISSHAELTGIRIIQENRKKILLTQKSNRTLLLNTIISGELWFERKRLQGVVDGINSLTKKNAFHLTEKEIEIVNLICEGLSNKEIRKSLKITEQSVRAHLSRIYKKTGVSDRLQLALLAVNTRQFY